MLFNTESMQQNKDPSRNLLIKHKLGKWKAEWRCKTWRSENTCTNIPTRASLAISNQLNKIQSKKIDHFWYLNFPVCCMVSTSAPRKELWQALTGSNSQNGELLQSNPQELCITLHNKSWEHDASAFLLGGSVNMNQLWMCDWEMFIFFFWKKNISSSWNYLSANYGKRPNMQQTAHLGKTHASVQGCIRFCSNPVGPVRRRFFQAQVFLLKKCSNIMGI